MNSAAFSYFRFQKIISGGILTSLLLTIFFYQSGCEETHKNVINEGIIEYDISYPPGASQDKILASMMPSKLTMYFKDNVTRSDISIGMGIMNASFISDPVKKNLVTLLQIVDKKYALTLDSSQVTEELQQKVKWKMEPTGDKKKICGYSCRKTIATDAHGQQVELFYTNDLNIKNSNWSTPMHGIDGVLLEYDLILNNVRMKLTATKIEGKTIDKETFNVPAGYVATKKEDMPEIFSQFFN